jgi:hypothetical protein
MGYLTNKEFAEQLFRQEKRNEYTNALMEEVRRLREENAELRAERDALRECKAAKSPIEPR